MVNNGRETNIECIFSNLPHCELKQFNNKGIRAFLSFTGIFTIIVLILIIYFLFQEAIPFFANQSILSFLFGELWNPSGRPPPEEFGAFPMIFGTLGVTFIGLIFAIPLGIGTAIFISEIAPKKVKSTLKSAVEILAGIPSVVYGFFGMKILTQWIRINFELSNGDGWFACSILLGIMALPTIISVAEDAISAVPREYREASYAMGASKWQTISKVIVPSAISGITAGVILGMGRIIGETMAVMMIAGNTQMIPDPWWNIFHTISTLTSVIGTEMREVPLNSMWYHSLFALAVVLFLITLLVNTIATSIMKKMNEKFHPRSKLGTTNTKSNTIKKQRMNTATIKKVVKVIKRLIIILISIMIGLLIYPSFGIIGILILMLFAISVVIFVKKASQSVIQYMAFSIISLAAIIVIILLTIIIGNIFIQGIGMLSLEYLLSTDPTYGVGGGLLQPILGTIWLIFGTMVFAIPLGIGAGIYLAEYSKESKLTSMIRAAIDNLNGTPSIIFGLFGFTFFVFALNLGFSLLAGCMTMALMVLPTIIRVTEEAIKTVPKELREASYAVGSSKWDTIKNVVLPTAKPSMITGVILAMGRVAGETAPIMYISVSFIQRFRLIPDFTRTLPAMSYHLYVLATEMPGGSLYAGATALALLILVVLFFSLASILRSYYKKRGMLK